MPVKRVAAIHDLSGYGKASLTVVIPTLSAMGIQVCPLPTALLSTHTGISGSTFLDLTAEMRKIIAHWKSLNLAFDAIYSGFLGSPEQVDVVLDFIKDFSKNKPLVLVDPVLGDDGALYSTMNNEMVEKMRELVKMANVVTPNLTEAALLTGRKFDSFMTLRDLEECARKISSLGPRYVVITSAYRVNEYYKEGGMAIFDKMQDACQFVTYRQLSGNFSGTGDLFASVLLGDLLQDGKLMYATARASQFVSLVLKLTLEEYCQQEILLEKALSWLDKK